MDVTGNRNKVRCKQQYCKEQYCIGTWNVRSLIQGKFSLPQFSHLVVSDSLPPPWNAACQASLSINNAQSLFKLISTELVMPSNYLILCCTLLLCLQSFPASGAFHESAFRIRWPKYWSFSFNINPSNKYSGLISFKMDWLDLLQPKGLSRVFSNTTVQKHQFFSALISL